MKKFNKKIFFTIFTILSSFILIVLVVNTYQNYHNQKRDLEKVLYHDMLAPTHDDKGPFFFDYDVYTVFLDDGKIESIVSHNDADKLEDIANEASKILTNAKTSSHIGNLYTNHYAYHFIDDDILVIVDTSLQSKRLVSSLTLNFGIFLILEVIIFFISNFLTKWISKPVEDAFVKQKSFVADASHELKTPLAVIMASTDAYENDHKQKWLDNIKEESNRMNKLITDLLDLAKLESQKEIVKKKENLSEILENEILTFESLFYENKIKIKESISKDIYFDCDKDSIKELLSILIDNAIKHTKDDGRIIFNLNKHSKDIIIEVQNEGDGIKKGDEEKIFERFYKADSSRNRKSNNYGLGLAIAKNIVLMHDGIISASSKDKVTTFKIVFPQK